MLLVKYRELTLLVQKEIVNIKEKNMKKKFDYCTINESLPGENPEHPIDVYGTIDFPSLQIYKIFTLWKDLTESHPDGGCCYFPDSILLKYEEKYYKIFPLDNHQGSLRRRYWYLIKPILEETGCTDITYNEGNLD